MKCSLGISNFLEEISRFSHSIVLLYFFALITEEGFLICSCYSLELCIQSSSTLDTSCKELTHWKRLWCWEGLGAGGEGDDRGWDGWMASLTRWTRVWVNSWSWWWTGRPGVVRFMGSQRVRHDWATELNWTYSCQLESSEILNQWLDPGLSQDTAQVISIKVQNLLGSCIEGEHL